MQSATPSTPQFDRLKALAGSWKATDEEGKTVLATYKIVSNGTALMESLDMADHADAMITMYHLDGGRVLLTHYCSMGNQPRMRAAKSTPGDSTLTFSFVDATNLPDRKDAHMSGLVVTFTDGDHFTQRWTMEKDGKTAHRAVFAFERVK
ncbi:MAG TPA: hypothetical protein VMW43_10885 [Bacteroidota bacterium]|nr:hypothetical protein [Bacteroidota bacterium]